MGGGVGRGNALPGPSPSGRTRGPVPAPAAQLSESTETVMAAGADEAADAAAQTILAGLGGLDVLIANQGYARAASVSDRAPAPCEPQRG